MHSNGQGLMKLTLEQGCSTSGLWCSPWVKKLGSMGAVAMSKASLPPAKFPKLSSEHLVGARLHAWLRPGWGCNPFPNGVGPHAYPLLLDQCHATPPSLPAGAGWGLTMWYKYD